MQYDILLVEDEPVASYDIRHRLQRMGCGSIRCAASAQEAQALVEERLPDVILMEAQLGDGQDGIATAASIMARHNVPVVYLSPDDDALFQRAKLTMPAGYLLKPFSDHELTIGIEMAVHRHQNAQVTTSEGSLLAETFHAIPDAIITIDASGTVAYCNDSAARMIPGIATGKSLTDLLSLYDNKGTACDNPVARLAAQPCEHGKTPVCMSATLMHDGHSIPVKARLTPMHDVSNVCTGAVLVLRDATISRRTEASLHKALIELRQTFRQTVSALAATSEKRDPYTAGHQARVAQLACAMARHLGHSEDVVEGIRVAAMLHDIGKINIPAEILAKPTKLSPLEMSIMRLHCQVGYDILREIAFPWPVADIVLQHHERLDGSGYPNALRDVDILPEARIVAVADVVEAMSSHRPYRPARGIDLAFEEIASGRGIRYDAQVVDACRAVFTKDFTFA